MARPGCWSRRLHARGFLSLPLTGLAVIGNPDDRDDEGKTVERAKLSKLPVEV
jgi:hypothetical protein